MQTDFYMVTTTVGSETLAAELARRIVESRLGRCVQIVPKIRSIYHWDGEICDDDECLLIIKTARSNLDHLLQILPTLHPYDVPEILVTPVTGGHEPYLKWLNEWVYKDKL